MDLLMIKDMKSSLQAILFDSVFETRRLYTVR